MWAVLFTVVTNATLQASPNAITPEVHPPKQPEELPENEKGARSAGNESQIKQVPESFSLWRFSLPFFLLLQTSFLFLLAHHSSDYYKQVEFIHKGSHTIEAKVLDSGYTGPDSIFARYSYSVNGKDFEGISSAT